MFVALLLLFVAADLSEEQNRNLLKVEEIIKQMEKMRVKPDSAVYNLYLKCKTDKTHSVNDAFDVLELMRSKNIQPDAFTYSIMARVARLYGTAGDVEECYHEMLNEKRMKPSIQLYGSFIAAFAKHRNSEKMQEILDLMAAYRYK